MDDPADIRRVFGENLQQLIATKGSVTSVAADLGINRTQLNRYIRSDSFPRPDVLSRICDYFDVDARIFTTPLERQNEQFKLPSGHVITPPPVNILPDGIYAEWTVWSEKQDKAYLHLIQISHRDGLCHVRVFARPPEFFDLVDSKRITARSKGVLRECFGFAISQGQRIATIDGLKDKEILAFTTYLPGFLGNMDFFLGAKLAGTQYRSGKAHNYMPCLLQKLPQTTESILSWARLPQVYNMRDLPLNVAAAFNSIPDPSA